LAKKKKKKKLEEKLEKKKKMEKIIRCDKNPLYLAIETPSYSSKKETLWFLGGKGMPAPNISALVVDSLLRNDVLFLKSSVPLHTLTTFANNRGLLLPHTPEKRSTYITIARRRKGSFLGKTSKAPFILGPSAKKKFKNKKY